MTRLHTQIEGKNEQSLCQQPEDSQCHLNSDLFGLLCLADWSCTPELKKGKEKNCKLQPIVASIPLASDEFLQGT